MRHYNIQNLFSFPCPENSLKLRKVPMKVYQYHTDDLKLIMKKTLKGIKFFCLHTSYQT